MLRYIWSFPGLLNTHTLSVRPLESTDIEKLKVRGSEFVKYAGTHFLEYTGLMIVLDSRGRILKYRARDLPTA